MNKWVALVGNPLNTVVSIHGPFDTEKEAQTWAGLEARGQTVSIQPLRPAYRTASIEQAAEAILNGW